MKFLVPVLSLVLLVALLMTGCQVNSGESTLREIEVGAILPLDGQWATIGKHSEVALNLALDSLNDYLEPDNLKVKLLIENSDSDPQKALDALKKLHKKGIKAIVGPCTSAEAAAVVSYANENGIILVSPSSTAVSLALDDNLFRLGPNDDNQAEALAMLIQQQQFTQIVMVYTDDEYGRGLDVALKDKAANPDFDFQVVQSIPFDATITNHNSLVDTITAAAAGLDTETCAIVLVGSESHAAGIFSSAGIQSPLAEFKWFSGDGIIRESSLLADNTTAEFAVKARLEGVAFACEETLTFVPMMLAAGLMSAELGVAPSPDSLPAWDALWYIAETYRRSPDADVATFKTTLKALSNEGSNVFSQIMAFDDNGDIKAAKYARFSAIRTGDSKYRWNLDGMFIKNITVGTFLTDAESNVTRESGDVVIGVVLPLTGTEKETGNGAIKAIELALEHASHYYSKTANVDIRFSIDARDSGSEPATALSQAKALHQTGVNVIIWPGNSAELSAVQDYARENNIIIISTRSTAISLADSDDLIYRLSPDDTNQAKAMIRLLETQGKTHLVVLYRDDLYGQDFMKAISAAYQGAIESCAYPAAETDFSPVVTKAAAAVEKAGNYQDTAVLVIGINEVTRLLETVQDGPLTAVSWYGTDGIAQSKSLLASSRAVAVADATSFTCSNIDVAAQRTFFPMHQVAMQYLSHAIEGIAAWNELAAYDAAWLAMNAYAFTSPDAGYQELWSFINNRYGAGGAGSTYVVNSAQDQSLSIYAFYTVTDSSSGPAWKATAYYRDILYARDDLYIIP